MRRAQRGVVLMVALIFLVLLTILAISASGRSLLQERMAGGLHNAQMAAMSADTALRGAEWKLWTSTAKLTGTPLLCGAGAFAGSCYRYDPSNASLYGANGIVSTFRTSPAWNGWDGVHAQVYRGPSGSIDYTTTDEAHVTMRLARNPVYIIEDMGEELPPDVSGGLHESGSSGYGSVGAGGISRHVYRITARATGGDQNTVRVLESTFAAKSN
jgi:type IV pilus assembly protein PilX